MEKEQIPEQTPIIVAEKATIGYGKKAILKDVNMEIHSGDFWCFIGSNGSGKTSLIKSILGAIRTLKGIVFLRKDFARRTRIGFVPQESELNKSVSTTLEEFVSCGLAGITFKKSVRQKRTLKVMEIMGIKHIKNSSIWNVSGGQRQRAMIARALVRDPLLMIVDEPTSGLDFRAAHELLKTITDLNREKKITVIFVTHDLNICQDLATHVAMFHDKNVIAGAKQQVFNNENLEKTFGIAVNFPFRQPSNEE
ncbi:metal ABC transporter ATP-binding protein [Candidatus Uabimicrobium sp. HlEnr_7]|uniref:metal ABC transporter ATP-binding protein n=1 Tax=Candidatus Uabimicrobium helgolandensis TaxID=3095367 RepID=UPI0035570853